MLWPSRQSLFIAKGLFSHRIARDWDPVVFEREEKRKKPPLGPVHKE